MILGVPGTAILRKTHRVLRNAYLVIFLHDSGVERMTFLLIEKLSDKVIRTTGKVLYSGVNDVSFVQQLVDKSSTYLCIDPNRLYASGHSNGGFTYTLASDPGTPL
jgi:predicted peptidase